MAFAVPLEADKVDDSNLLVSVVRGTIMWIIGEDNEMSDAQLRPTEEDLRRGLEDMMLDDTSSSSVDPGHDEHKSPWIDSRMDDESTDCHRRQTLPRMVHSDVSVAGDVVTGDSTNALVLPRCQGETSFGRMLHSIHHNNDNISNDQLPLEKPEKKFSWSENLVEYMDDESVRHEPPSSSASAAGGSTNGLTKPIKSAMTRSTSVRSAPLAAGGLEDSSKERKIRYLPNGLDRAHNGIIMPSIRPVNNHDNGIESPQWGWYTMNTTPPTPEMYHSRSSLKQSSSDKMSSSSAATADVNAAAAAAVRGPNRVFQGLKAGSNRPPVGWPSVPL